MIAAMKDSEHIPVNINIFAEFIPGSLKLLLKGDGQESFILLVPHY
mgnify:CR=1 FL=1